MNDQYCITQDMIVVLGINDFVEHERLRQELQPSNCIPAQLKFYNDKCCAIRLPA